MTDAIRDRLAASLAERYEMQREIGRGGMATVYLARDIRHQRNVALKLLDPDLGAVLGAERFLSEIRVTANLQHPNLLPLFDSGATDGLLWYVMPYVEGESLRARLDRERQLPIDAAVHIATAIAGALDYAHQHGIIHRDLKPENILLQHGEPVVADFGIALAISNAGGQRVTQTGLSLGTPLYMSPEQATGDRAIDARSDIYSLGAVTYEMIAGEPPHTGASSQAIIARLMTEVPRPLSTVRPSVPEHVDEAVQCALEKLPADRFATARELADALRGGTGSAPLSRVTRKTSARGRASRRIVVVLIAACAAAIVLAVLLARALARPEPPSVQFVLDLPADQRLFLARGSSVSLSPDGRTIAYVAAQKDFSYRVYVRSLDSLNAHPFPGGESSITPQFSPDGRWLAMRTADDLRRVPVAGGPPDILKDLQGWQGYAWAAKSGVLLAADNVVWLVGPDGARTRLTTVDSTRSEALHSSPWPLTDDVFGFSIRSRKSRLLSTTIGVARMGEATHTDLGIPGDSPLGLIDGHLLYSSLTGALLAIPFDARQLKVSGSAVALLDSVVGSSGGLHLSISPSGTLTYIRGSVGRRLSIMDAGGATVARTPEARAYGQAALSPDGAHVAFSLVSSVGTGATGYLHVWMWDVSSGALSRLSTDAGAQPKWIDGGKRIEYLHCPPPCATAPELWTVAIDGSAPPRLEHRLLGARVPGSMSISRSGRYGAFAIPVDSTNLFDIYVGELTSMDVKLVPLVTGPGQQSAPLISPDERWLAYTSDESGRSEVFLQPLHGPGPRTRISVDGGENIDWASDGTRLVYRHGTAHIAATVDWRGGSPVVTRRDTLRMHGQRANIEPHSNKTLLVGEPEEMRIVVVTNWLAQAKARLRSIH
jgi:serine/threonine-protein kinase